MKILFLMIRLSEKDALLSRSFIVFISRFFRPRSRNKQKSLKAKMRTSNYHEEKKITWRIQPKLIKAEKKNCNEVRFKKRVKKRKKKKRKEFHTFKLYETVLGREQAFTNFY